MHKTNVLLIEDNPDDAFLIQEMLAEGNGVFELTHADRLSKGLERVAAGGLDAILLDLSLPDSHGFDTFARVQAQAPGVPIVVLSGFDDEALAIKAVKEGAQDYLVKGQGDGSLLVRSVRYAVERKQLELEREQLIGELRDALAMIKTLGGLLPICASYKKIRDDQGDWTQLEVYISEHSEANFSHGLCPPCAKTLYPDYYEDD
jgi:DNA-binding response OmpR family regulator